ncbi:hypothetical protein CQW23_27933 [Capsicum baccatum]|uniref:ABC transporter family G domain-containing protein n=1 Tax=Capsicum baccatum TaxID=33114 RepID=A0A2G2VF57_CAPBA|nr:hypothetical protein CQW23_27933 [Capsicum baccatum]
MVRLCLGTLAEVSVETFGLMGYLYTGIAVPLLTKIPALRSFSLERDDLKASQQAYSAQRSSMQNHANKCGLLERYTRQRNCESDSAALKVARLMSNGNYLENHGQKSLVLKVAVCKQDKLFKQVMNLSGCLMTLGMV